MTIVVLLILAILWGVVLVPPLLRARSERNRSSVGVFNRGLHALGGVPRSMGAGPLTGPATRPAKATRVSPRTAKRRRDILAILAFATLVSLAGAAVTGQGLLWALFALSALALGAYVWALASADRLAASVTPLHLQRMPRRSYQPAPVTLRRSVGS